MGTYRIDLAYLGTGFHGYAVQPNVRTVQGDLEAALTRVIGPVETDVAGRTDKGVHASGQVVSFSTEASVDCVRLQRSLNSQLAPEIAIINLELAADDFHARFSATGRRYIYRILNRTAPDPFLAATSWHFPTPLDLEAMNEGCASLVGIHDFIALCRFHPGRSTERELRIVSWTNDGPMKHLEVEASSFCHQMVRSIVAISVDVGRGKLRPSDVARILEGQDRNLGSGAAPAYGLTLVEVSY
ncbi:MAG: tRNA pseudouridine(38-40) synthase TruA [Acidimicrobiia bacterium]|nr:tRNA pseudouridine(38-40) synthase TruA [Acidimicrobiia bacterium]